MAKTFKPKTTGITVDDENTTGDSVEVVSDTKEESVENPVETVETVKTETTPDDVQVNLNVVQKPAVKNVKILPKENHSCCIGGVRYFLKKGVQTNVPQEVKDILNKSGLLMPL